VTNVTKVPTTKEILENSNTENPVTPEEAKSTIEEELSGIEISEVEFDEVTGKYTIRGENKELIEMCAVCGRKQAMNDEAMSLIDPALTKEIEDYYWDNNRCEQKHKPFSIH
jgi:hypothetical protein